MVEAALFVVAVTGPVFAQAQPPSPPTGSEGPDVKKAPAKQEPDRSHTRSPVGSPTGAFLMDQTRRPYSTATAVPVPRPRFLGCGGPRQGVARVQGETFLLEYLPAFSCKARYFGPSCHQKGVLQFGG